VGTRHTATALSVFGVVHLSTFGEGKELAGLYLGGLVEECGERFGDGCGIGTVLGEGFG
jgi:hypothetical protein